MATTFDDRYQDENNIDIKLIKIDFTEGNEIKILNGASVLKNCNPIIMLMKF